MKLNDRHRRILRILRRSGQLGRKQLHRALSVRPNTVGALVDQLIAEGFVREDQPRPQGRGRPQVPLLIDANGLRVVGIAVRPRRVYLGRMNLLGEPTSQPVSWRRSGKRQLQEDLRRAIHEAGSADSVAAIGVSLPGLIDLESDRVVSSAGSARAVPVAFDELRGGHPAPIILNNDMHAIAAQWLLTERIAVGEDTLLVYLEDGAVGSVLLVDGRPNHGCVLGGNELGHMRYAVHTELCYCGQRGCLERICSSKFLKQNGDRRGLMEAAAAFSERSPVNDVCHHLAVGLANCVNFIRPHRVHLISPLTEAEAFCNALVQRVRGQVLNGLADRLTIEWSSPPADGFSQAAGWLGLTAVYLGDWSRGLNDRQAAPAYRRGCDS